MTTVYDIYSFIEDIAPYRLQESYDNSGLNVGEMSAEVRSVLVALDCTAEGGKERLVSVTLTLFSPTTLLFSED